MNFGKIGKQEVNEGTSDGSWTIEFRSFVDFGLCYFGNLDFFWDFDGDSLRILQIFNKSNIIQNITLGVGQLKQQLCFQFIQLNFEIILLSNKLKFLGSQIRSFSLHNQIQQLITKTVLGDCKVNKGCFGLHFRRIMRIWQFGLHK